MDAGRFTWKSHLTWMTFGSSKYTFSLVYGCVFTFATCDVDSLLLSLLPFGILTTFLPLFLCPHCLGPNGHTAIIINIKYILGFFSCIRTHPFDHPQWKGQHDSVTKQTSSLSLSLSLSLSRPFHGSLFSSLFHKWLNFLRPFHLCFQTRITHYFMTSINRK